MSLFVHLGYGFGINLFIFYLNTRLFSGFSVSACQMFTFFFFFLQSGHSRLYKLSSALIIQFKEKLYLIII